MRLFGSSGVGLDPCAARRNAFNPAHASSISTRLGPARQVDLEAPCAFDLRHQVDVRQRGLPANGDWAMEAPRSHERIEGVGAGANPRPAPIVDGVLVGTEAMAQRLKFNLSCRSAASQCLCILCSSDASGSES